MYEETCHRCVPRTGLCLAPRLGMGLSTAAVRFCMVHGSNDSDGATILAESNFSPRCVILVILERAISLQKTTHWSWNFPEAYLVCVNYPKRLCTPFGRRDLGSCQTPPVLWLVWSKVGSGSV